MRPIRENWVYRKLSSTKTAIILLLVLSGFYLLGTVFPQGVDYESYEKAGGTLLFAARYLGVLHIFSTPLFIAVAVILGMNTIVCSIERTRILAKPGRKLPRTRAETVTLSPGIDGKAASAALEEYGFKVMGEGSEDEDGTIKLKKGPNLSALSVAFHVLTALCIAAFFHTYLFSYENYITVGKGEETEITLKGGKKAPFKLKLNDFSTVYVDNPEIQFPDEPLLRIATIINGPSEQTRFVLHEGAISVSDWISDVSLLKDGKELMKAKVKVGRPLTYGGLRIYQMGYEQKVTLSVDGREMNVSPGKPFEVDGEKFVISSVKHGKWRRLDGKEESVKPHVILYRVTGKTRYDRAKLGRIFESKPVKISGKTYRLKSFDEKSVFSYRVDPAVGFLYIAGFLVNLLILLRLTLTEEVIELEKNESGVWTAKIRASAGFGKPKGPEILARKGLASSPSRFIE